MPVSPIALLAQHPLVVLNMPHNDLERHRCARYLHHLQAQQHAELSRAEVLAAIERCRCQPGEVGRELGVAESDEREAMNTHSPTAWEQVDEIRKLYASGQMTLGALTAKYGINKGTISRMVNYRTWKPENDPRCKERVGVQV